MNQLEGIEPSSPNNGGGYASRGNDNGDHSVSIVQLGQRLGWGRDGVVFAAEQAGVKFALKLVRCSLSIIARSIADLDMILELNSLTVEQRPNLKMKSPHTSY